MIIHQHPWWQEAWKALCSRWSSQGYDSLTSEEKVWLNVRSFIDSTENGGVISFYYNSGAETLADTMKALDRLGSETVRLQAEQVNRLFGSSVPGRLDERNDVINSWGDDPSVEQLLKNADEALMPMFDALEKRLEQFIRDQRLAEEVTIEPN